MSQLEESGGSSDGVLSPWRRCGLARAMPLLPLPAAAAAAGPADQQLHHREHLLRRRVLRRRRGLGRRRPGLIERARHALDDVLGRVLIEPHGVAVGAEAEALVRRLDGGGQPGGMRSERDERGERGGEWGVREMRGERGEGSGGVRGAGRR